MQCPKINGASNFFISFLLKDVVTLREVATTFDQGAHHPTMLVILQALVALMGEVLGSSY